MKIDEILHFTGSDVNKMKKDIINFIRDEMNKFHLSPADTRDFIKHLLNSINLKTIKEDILNEMPWAVYHESGIGTIDFQIEKMNIPKKEKDIFIKAFNSGKGILGKLKNKLLKFTPAKISIIKGKKPNLPVLPKKWTKTAKILDEKKEV